MEAGIVYSSKDSLAILDTRNSEIYPLTGKHPFQWKGCFQLFQICTVRKTALYSSELKARGDTCLRRLLLERHRRGPPLQRGEFSPLCPPLLLHQRQRQTASFCSVMSSSTSSSALEGQTPSSPSWSGGTAQSVGCGTEESPSTSTPTT